MMKAVILAAGVGSRLGDETADKPKPLVKIHHRSLLFRQLDSLAKAGIAPENVVVIGGYRIAQISDALASEGFRTTKVLLNERFEPPWGNFLSLLRAAPELRGHAFLQVDGDLIVDDNVLPGLIAAPGEAVLCTDPNVELDDDTMRVELDDKGVLVALDKKNVDHARVVGEYIGVTKLSAEAGEAVFDELQKLLAESEQRGEIPGDYYERAYERLSRSGRVPFGVHMLEKSAVWREIDDLNDLADARAKFS